MDAATDATHDPTLMFIFAIPALILLVVWLVVSIVFLAGYKHSLSS